MTITARYPGRCHRCGGEIRPGDRIDWSPETRKAQHVRCPKQHRDDDFELLADAYGEGAARAMLARRRRGRAHEWPKEIVSVFSEGML